MILRVGNNEYELATTLRVVYKLREIAGAKSLQAAVNSIQDLDLDGQLELLYAAHVAATPSVVATKETFIGDILDNLGIFAVTNVINELADGLLYSGLAPEEIESKKAQVEMLMTTTGQASSAAATN